MLAPHCRDGTIRICAAWGECFQSLTVVMIPVTAVSHLVNNKINKIDKVLKNLKSAFFVIPAKVGILYFQ